MFEATQSGGRLMVDSELLDIHSAALRLRVSDSTIKNEVRRGRLGSVKLRDRRLIPPSAERYIDLLKQEAGRGAFPQERDR